MLNRAQIKKKLWENENTEQFKKEKRTTAQLINSLRTCNSQPETSVKMAWSVKAPWHWRIMRLVHAWLKCIHPIWNEFIQS